MSFKKIILSFLMLGFTCSSITQTSAISLDNVADAAATFGIGYMAGVTPILWPCLPFALAKKEFSDRIAMTTGFATGIAVLGLAFYGLKKLLEKKADPKGNNTQLI